jgi:sphingosine kinase
MAADALVQRVRCCAAWQGNSKPPRVHAIINPTSGRGSAARAFQRSVAPLLEDAAGFVVTCTHTSHAGHAAELVASLDIGSTELLLLVGGDGTVHEALQGLLNRPDWDVARTLPLVHVPGGSGNGLAHLCGLQVC